ncbi:MAG: hypothetical protein J4400_02580 [Candidatus Aenigmarchaeota archaeon]|nr:hypothetical protein [Candidatus Aenigmarchaeota archaeon]
MAIDDSSGELRSLARKIGTREYVVSVGGDTDYVTVSDIGMPGMNGRPLSSDELYSVDRVTYRGEVREAQRHENGVAIHTPDGVLVLPFCGMDDVHDYTHLMHCLDSGTRPAPESMIDLINREDVEKYLEASR